MPKEELLTNEEISALLPDQPADDAAAERGRRERIVPYNFRRPDRLSKEHVRSLYMLHDNFANSLTSSLPLFLRTVSEVTLISVEQQSYNVYLKGLADPTTIFTLATASPRGVFAVEFSPSIAFPIKVGLSASDYYEFGGLAPFTGDDSKFGYFSIAGIVTVPLGANFNVHGGAELQTFGENLKIYNGFGDDNDSSVAGIASIGLGFSF